jgi:uncharacterized membrane protein
MGKEVQKKTELNKERVWEIDLLRGVALLLMIYFHLIYDMDVLFSYNVSYQSSFNWYVGKASGTLFIFIAGISSYLSRDNKKRALKILGMALVISVVTHFYDPELGIKFGILHFLGTAILLSLPLLRLKNTLLISLGVIIIILGPFIAGTAVEHDWFFPLGLSSGNFISSDYYPLIPWLGVFLFGLAAGRYFYREKKSLFSFTFSNKFLIQAGRNTLVIYLIHQPVILLVLFLIREILS